MSENISSLKVTPPPDDDFHLRQLLQEFNLEAVFDYLKAAHVSFRSLQYLKGDDLKEAIPPLGLRVEFRKKLLVWKKKELGLDDDTLTIPSKVTECLQETPNCYMSPTNNSSTGGIVLNKDLRILLGESVKGKAILEYSKEHSDITCTHRVDIIDIIIEDIIANNIVLKPHDFTNLVHAIGSVFPHEQHMKDFYYIPRKGKNNPSGKLFAKYKNKVSKRRKLVAKERSISSSSTSEEPSDGVEIDNAIAAPLKTCLNRDCADWNDVCDKWKKTYHVRQRDLKELKSFDFLKAWSKLSHSRAPDLIKIDFELMYPSKGHLLYSKWDNFKSIISKYYERNINNHFCKQLVSNATVTPNIDAQEYLYTILLNAIIPPSARFKDDSGKRNKKVTISEAQESLVLVLLTTTKDKLMK